MRDKYKVLLYDSFSNEGCTIATNLDISTAITLAENKTKSSQMTIAYVLHQATEKVVFTSGKY